LARCILLTIDKINKENLIISTSEEYSIKDIAKVIAVEFEYTEHLGFNANYSDGQYKKQRIIINCYRFWGAIMNL
jgi:hypothetical protein